MDKDTRNQALRAGVGTSTNADLARWLLDKAVMAVSYGEVSGLAECAARLDADAYTAWMANR